MTKTKEQLQAEKEIAMKIRVPPLEIEGLGAEKLRDYAQKLWDQIVQLVADQYDMEEKSMRLDYDVCVHPPIQSIYSINYAYVAHK